MDLDPQAVEVTMMNLYLKALEDERDLPQKQHLLPELGRNIRCGNSLIAPDIADEQELSPEELDRLKPFDWRSQTDGFGDILKSGGFQTVLGNPPYGDTLTSMEKRYLVEVGYEAGGSGNNDIFRFIVEKGLLVLREQGRLGMILPNTFLAGSKYRNFRTRVKDLSAIEEIVDFGTQKVFDVDVFSSILTLLKVSGEKARKKTIVSYISNGLPASELLENRKAIRISRVQMVDGDWIPQNPVLERLRENPAFIPMHEVFEIKDAGINYQRVGVGWQKRARSKLAERILYTGRQRNRKDQRYIKGEDIEPYRIKPLASRWLRHNYKRYVEPNEVVAFGKRILERPEKIVTRQTGDSIIAAIDRKKLYTGRSLHSWVVKQGQNVNLELALGILNSKLMTYLYQATSREKGRAMAQVKLNKLRELPFPNIVRLNSSEKALLSKIERTVMKMQGSIASQELSELAAKSDQLVYQLYGLTPEEIALVERAVGRRGTT